MNTRKRKKLQEKGITLVALVVTIIVILILAGITLSFIFRQNGILERAQMGYQVNREETIKEEIQVAYGAAQVDSITKGLPIDEVLQTELRKEDSTATAELNGNIIDVHYKEYETTINIITGGLTELTKIATTNPENDENDPYRGLLTVQDKIDGNLFYYEPITNPTTGANNETKLASSNPVKLADTSTTSGTARIAGINLEYVFSKEFNDNNSENWPEIVDSTATGANSAYINAMKPYVERLIIPNEVTLNSNGEIDPNGQKYKITEIRDLLYPGSKDIDNVGPEDIALERIGEHWGTGCPAETFILWESPDLNINIIIPEGVTRLFHIGDRNMLPNWGTGYNYGRQSIKSVSFPNTIQYLGYSAFYQCKGLTEITLPPTIQCINPDAFVHCDNLKKITAPLGVADPGDAYGVWPENLEELIGNGGTTVGSENTTYSEFFRNYQSKKTNNSRNCYQNKINSW